jgi:glutathione S-transferase
MLAVRATARYIAAMTDTPHFTLYAETLWISPYVFSSFVALKEKGVHFAVAEVALVDGAHLEPTYRDASLTARVPSVDHDGFRLAESSAIAEYLDDILPAPAHPPLLPDDVRDRARARQLMAWLRSDLGALRDERSTVTMFYRFRLPPLTAAGERDARKLLRVADQMIPTGGGALFGDWCLADSELAFMLHRLILTGENVPERIRSYADAQWRRPSVRAFAEHARPKTVPDSYWTFSGTSQLPTA